MVSLVALDDAAGAIDVAKSAVILPVGPATDIVRLIAACAEVINDNPSSAGEWLASARPAQLTPYNANLLAIVRQACDLATELDGGARWNNVKKRWTATLNKKTGPLKNDFTAHVVARCEQLLHRRRPNTPYKWLAARSAQRAERKRKGSREAYQRTVAPR
jgi:hypothetical protein